MTRSQRGYALTETLIAAAIAAGVAASTTSMTYSAVRLTNTSKAHSDLLADAHNITARLRAHEPLATIEKDYTTWSIIMSDVLQEIKNANSAKLITYNIKHDQEAEFEFEIVTLQP